MSGNGAKRKVGLARDVLLMLVGSGLLIYEAVVRSTSDRVIVIAALGCLGVSAAGFYGRKEK